MALNNTLFDLNNHLFESLERLQTSATAEELQMEGMRAKSVANVAGKIIDNAKVVLEAKKHADQYGKHSSVPRLLTGD